jgi:hypothetical protein
MKGGLRRRSDLESVTVKEDVPMVIESRASTVFNGISKRYSTRKKWAVTRWSLDSNSLLKTNPNNDRIRQLARRAVLGETVDIYTAWNLLPWSWMADWFSDLGDYISSSRNTVGASPGVTCVMTHTTHFNEIVRISGPAEIQGGGGRRTTDIKHRVVVGGSLPELQIPVLNPKQLSILASLAILRRR